MNTTLPYGPRQRRDVRNLVAVAPQMGALGSTEPESMKVLATLFAAAAWKADTHWVRGSAAVGYVGLALLPNRAKYSRSRSSARPAATPSRRTAGVARFASPVPGTNYAAPYDPLHSRGEGVAASLGGEIG